LTPILIATKIGLIRTDLWVFMATTVTTAKAAQVIGIGYEGLRSYLKRGLLGSSGFLPPLVGRDAAAPDLTNVRSTWKRFGFTDLCLMRLAKQLIDLGLNFEQANTLVSHEGLRPLFREQAEITDAVLMCWPPHYDFILFKRDDLHLLPLRLDDVGNSALVIKLDATAKHTRTALNDLAMID
jgi:hypothetical protein